MAWRLSERESEPFSFFIVWLARTGQLTDAWDALEVKQRMRVRFLTRPR